MKTEHVKLNLNVKLNESFDKRTPKDFRLAKANGLYISDSEVFDGAFNSPYVKIKDNRGEEYLVYIKNLDKDNE